MMRTYTGTALLERQTAAERLRQRYRSDPAYRLYHVNKSRQRAGRSMLSSVGQIRSKPELAAQRQRDGRGRFA